MIMRFPDVSNHHSSLAHLRVCQEQELQTVDVVSRDVTKLLPSYWTDARVNDLVTGH